MRVRLIWRAAIRKWPPPSATTAAGGSSGRCADGAYMQKMLSVVLATFALGLTGFALSAASGGQVKAMPLRVGSSPGSRLLVIEAEDLGMAHAIDQATFEAIDEGWVTSAGVLVAAPWFPEVAFWANQHRQADLGVQLRKTAQSNPPSEPWRRVRQAGNCASSWATRASPDPLPVPGYAAAPSCTASEFPNRNPGRRPAMSSSHTARNTSAGAV